jgi:outer membrane immunogenic protein
MLDGAEQFNISPDGYIGGAQIGYNWQAANWVYGLEADFQGGIQKDDKTCQMLCGPNGFATFDQRMAWFGTVRGRLGYSVGSSLFYATGGLAYGEVHTHIADLSFGGVSQDTALSHMQTGWTAGAGLETPLPWFGRNWTVKAEYLYVDLGSASDTYVIDGDTRTFTSHAQEHIFRTGVNYHFNSPVVAKY